MVNPLPKRGLVSGWAGRSAPELGVATVGIDGLIVGSLFDEATVPHDHDAVRSWDGCQTVGNDEGGAGPAWAGLVQDGDTQPRISACAMARRCRWPQRALHDRRRAG